METLKADAEVTTLEAAQVAVEAIMIVDHMTEVVIVTAMIRVAVAVEVCSSLVSFFLIIEGAAVVFSWF